MADPIRKPTKLTPAQIERERAAQKKITFAIIEREPGMDLVDRRQGCSNHSLARAVQQMEAEGTPMPAAHEVCLKTLRETSRRGNEGHLFVNLALQHQGVLEYSSTAHDALLANGEVGKTFRSVFRAARDGLTTYRTIRADLPEAEQFKPLDCPLALDAGYFYAASATNKPMQVLTPKARDAAVKACYNPDNKGDQLIEVDGEKMPLNKAGLLAGENIGRALRAELDKLPKAPATPVAPPPATPSAPTGQASPPAKAAQR